MTDRIEQMRRTTFAGQLDLDGQEQTVTVVAPPQPVEKPVDRQKGSDRSLDQPLPF